ncbi:MAG TPA: patatin-like phospholipase family protein [Xanthobacteraceae bacterium]|nr:patatin-like phospholipase family protein [Xanthobacteraceae bacterium]
MTEQSDGLCPRDRHWFAPGPKRILSLDGGGVRGAIEVAFLERIEQVLSEHHRAQTAMSAMSAMSAAPGGAGAFRLSDWFDLVGGTSTGAVIAGALALGYTTAQLKEFYLDLAPSVFVPRWHLGLRPKFGTERLRQEIAKVVGDRTLDSEDLRTGLCVVTKRMDTGSPWIVANNPRAPYWTDKPPDPATGDKGYRGNRHYRLADLVRASTAAPYYFEPEPILVVEGETAGTFIDGGVTPHNNPALILFLMTTLKAYGINWKAGPENLTLVSIGTGRHRKRAVPEEFGIGSNLWFSIGALVSLMNDSQEFVLMLMQYLGQSITDPWPINSEVGTLVDDEPSIGKQFRFLRYDIELDAAWIAKHLGEKISESEVLRLREMDNPENIRRLYELAAIAARKQVKPEHWIEKTPQVIRPSAAAQT